MRVALRALACILLVVMVGCTGSQTASQETEQSSLKPLAIFYSRFQSQHQGRPPANEAELREFVSTFSAEDLQAFGVSSVDELFVSKRDNQPYVVEYGGTKNPPLGYGQAPIVAYEKEGVGGKRFVGSSLGGVEEVDEARFKELVPNPK